MQLRCKYAGKGVTIYILDSGIRASHQEFQPWDGSSEVRVTVGPDFVDNDGKADDCDGHGTHVASTGEAFSAQAEQLLESHVRHMAVHVWNLGQVHMTNANMP